MKNIAVMTDKKNLDFENARKMAMTEASEYLQNRSIAGYDSLIIVDAVQHRGKPGEIFWFKPSIRRRYGGT